MKIAWVATGLFLLSGAAIAQSSTEPPVPVAGEHAVPPDPGRAVAQDREGLSSRGGRNPTGSDKTFAETIGTPIYAPIATPIGTALGVRR